MRAETIDWDTAESAQSSDDFCDAHDSRLIDDGSGDRGCSVCRQIIEECQRG